MPHFLLFSVAAQDDEISIAAETIQRDVWEILIFTIILKSEQFSRTTYYKDLTNPSPESKKVLKSFLKVSYSYFTVRINKYMLITACFLQFILNLAETMVM